MKLASGISDGQNNPRPHPSVGSSPPRRRPAGWRQWSPAEKIEHLLGMSLDQMHDVLSWRAGEADPYRLSVQWQVARVILMVGAKHLLAAERQQQRSAALEDLARGFNGERP